MIYCKLAFTALFLAFALIDIRSQRIPNKLLFIAILIALPVVFFMGGFILGLIGCYIGLILFGIPYLWAPNRIGAGDVKLASLIGFIIGFPLVLLSLALALLSGGIISGVLVAFKRLKVPGSIPFAPFLCGGAIVTLWAGDWIISWYWGLF